MSVPGRLALVTGGAGFIGSHLVDALLQRGLDVVVLDDLSTGDRANLASSGDVELVLGSVLDDALVESLVASADEVFHLAGAVGVKLVMESPVRTIESIVEGTRIVLRHAATRGCRVVLTSSSEVYGPAASGPLRESDRLTLGPPSVRRWAYATAKLTAEHLALAYHTDAGLPATVARLFNTVGPRQSEAYGMVLPRFVAQALSGGPITVHGDGSQTRSFCDVRDVVRALIALSASERAIGRVVNVGADQPISIASLAERVRAVLGVAAPIERLSHEAVYGPGFEDVQSRIPDLSLLGDLIEFAPSYSIDDTIADLAKHARRGSDGAATVSALRPAGAARR